MTCPAISHFSKRVIFIALTLTLAGCGGRLEGVMKPVGPVSIQGATPVNMLVATTRQPSGDPAILFNGERGTSLKIDAVTISIPPDKNRKIGEVQWPKKLPPDPSKSFTTVSVTPLPTERDGRNWLRKNSFNKHRVLVFVHGFNNTYEDSVYRFAQIVHDSKTDVVPVLFTWPSRASIFDYNYDKESTNYSRDALEDLLTRVSNEPGVTDVTVMAHSMGSWLAVEALRQMAIRHGRVNAKIANVILASPDLDVDVFKSQFVSLGPKHPHFTIFVSRDDRALSISRRISGNVDRLGQINAAQEPYRSALEAAGVTVIDLTKLKTGDQLNHGKFAESPQVVRLIGDRLLSGQTVTDSNVGFGEALGAVAIGTSSTIGQVASSAISAPIMIFDARTRRNYNDQIKQVGNSAGSTFGALSDTVPR
ncbi:alpha/beta hydrolase [Allorhizobium terrae]|uniref:Alpha/beta fold hydrolase n=1 Tax=Allorhizobium terrae TaxID=1848972 RepID=A0A4S3ZXW2_9HYPH|nr:alpha/beta hydrolase [Allorhizobium terrae]THF50684.1 alpha/beta fold hydrolase [Allorhizobium terrae]